MLLQEDILIRAKDYLENVVRKRKAKERMDPTDDSFFQYNLKEIFGLFSMDVNFKDKFTTDEFTAQFNFNGIQFSRSGGKKYMNIHLILNDTGIREQTNQDKFIKIKHLRFIDIFTYSEIKTIIKYRTRTNGWAKLIGIDFITTFNIVINPKFGPQTISEDLEVWSSGNFIHAALILKNPVIKSGKNILVHEFRDQLNKSKDDLLNIVNKDSIFGLDIVEFGGKEFSSEKLKRLKIEDFNPKYIEELGIDLSVFEMEDNLIYEEKA